MYLKCSVKVQSHRRRKTGRSKIKRVSNTSPLPPNCRRQNVKSRVDDFIFGKL